MLWGVYFSEIGFNCGVKIFSKVAEMIMETMQTTKNGASFLYQNGACPLWGALCVLSQFIDKSLNSEN